MNAAETNICTWLTRFKPKQYLFGRGRTQNHVNFPADKRRDSVCDEGIKPQDETAGGRVEPDVDW
jgi:hypothetical protein